MQRITVRNTHNQTVKIRNSYVILGSQDPYTDQYRVTPSSLMQTLFTKGKGMRDNIVVEPIPKNYGLITYNGFELTIT